MAEVDFIAIVRLEKEDVRALQKLLGGITDNERIEKGISIAEDERLYHIYKLLPG